MYTKSLSWISVIALVPAVFLASSINYRIAIEFLVCWAAASVAIQAFRTRKYGWASIFLMIAVAFNPIRPISISDSHFAWLGTACMGMFLASLFYVKTMPRLAMVSIADRQAQ